MISTWKFFEGLSEYMLEWTIVEWCCCQLFLSRVPGVESGFWCRSHLSVKMEWLIMMMMTMKVPLKEWSTVKTKSFCWFDSLCMDFFYIIVCFNWIECSGRLSLLLLSFSFIDNIVIFLNVKKFRNPRYNDVLAD